MRHSREAPLADRRARVGGRGGESRRVRGVKERDGEKETEAEEEAEEEVNDAPYKRLPVTSVCRSWRSFAIFSGHSSAGWLLY